MNNIPSKIIIYQDLTYKLVNKSNDIVYTNNLDKLPNILNEINLENEDIFDSVENYNNYIRDLKHIIKKNKIILTDIKEPMIKEILYLLR
jgi:hypothetical protein